LFNKIDKIEILDKPSIEFKNVYYKYTGISASKNWVLNDISFSIAENESIAIVGASGSGKTTLIQHFTGLLKPKSGHVLYCGKDISGKKYPLADLRKKIGIVFQFPEAQLFEETVFKDVGFGPHNLGYSSEQIEDSVYRSLSDVDLDPEEFNNRSPFKLSEGEKRRVAIAGVLAMQPDIVVFDEPTAGLDPHGVGKIVDIINRLLQNGKTVIVITHNMDFVLSISTRVLVLESGSLILDGQPNRLFLAKDILERTGLELPHLIQAQMEFGDKLPPQLKTLKNSRQLLSLIK
jgi:energy-coupling factor transport system ATP-binding protein